MMRRQRGAALLTVIFFVVIMALLAGVTAYLVTGDAASTIDYQTSEQALNIAQGGMEQAIYQYKTGTACASLTNTNVALGNGTYTTSGTAQSATTTLSSGITATDTVIPVASLAGLGTHGFVSIGSEVINYTGTSSTSCSPYSAPCLTGGRRAQNLTTAAAHTAGQGVVENQCTIRSVGTAKSAQRTLEAVMLPAKAAYLDGLATTVGTSTTTIGSLATTLPAGDNIVLAKVSLRNINAHTTISAGNLRLLRNGILLDSNQFIIDVGGSPPSGTNFPQETQYRLFRDAGAPANSTYSLTALGNNGNTSAEVKMVVINSVQYAYDPGVVTNVPATPGVMRTFNTTLPAGNNLVITTIQINNTTNGTRSLAAGTLQLLRGATVLSTNQFTLNFARQSRVNQGTAIMLLARDAAPANASYTVYADASGNGIQAEVMSVVIAGVPSAFFDSGSVAVGTSATQLGAVATSFPAGENIVIASTQYENSTGNAMRIIAPGDERLLYNGNPQATSAFEIDLCTLSTAAECNDFDKGTMWRQAAGAPNPQFSVDVATNGTGLNGETKIMAFHLDNPIADWQEIFP